MSRRAWAIRGLGLVTFTSLVGASTGVSGNGGITGKATINQGGTYTVTQDIDLTGTSLGQGVAVITVSLSGGQAVLDLDGHSIKRAPGGPVIDLMCGAGGGEVLIRDGKVEGGADNIRATNCDVTVERVTAVGANQDGIHVDGGSLSVRESVVRGAAGNGIWGDSSSCGIEDSQIINPGLSGLALQEATQLAVARSTIRGAGDCGIELVIEEIPIPSISATFTDVKVLNARWDGYHLAGDIPVTIEGGLVRGGDRYGIYVGENGQAVSIAGVKLTDIAGPAAIMLNAVGGTARVSGSHIRSFAGDGIVANGAASASLRLEDNVVSSAALGIQSSETEGFRIDDVSVQIVGNTLEGPAGGMRVASDGAVIARNQVRMVRGNGIEIAGGSAVVRDNVVAGKATGVGILAGNGNNNVYVQDNKVRMFGTGLGFAPGTTVDANGLYRGNVLLGNTTAVTGAGIDGGDNVLF